MVKGAREWFRDYSHGEPVIEDKDDKKVIVKRKKRTIDGRVE